MLQCVVGDVPIGDAPAESRRGLSVKQQEETETVHLLAPRLSVVAAAGLALGLGACNAGDDDPSRRQPGARTGSGQSGASARNTEDVQFHTRDGVLLSGTLTVPRRGAPVVVLIHQLGSDRHDWDGFLPALERARYATLAYDTRGMGRSLSRWPSKTRYRPPMETANYLESMPRDVAAALSFLRRRGDIDSGRVALVGASLGANIAHAAAGAHEQVRATVVLSPGLPPPGVLRPKGSRPRAVLFASSRIEAAPVLELLDTVREPRLNILGSDAEAHGVGLLGDRRIRRAILDWLERHLAAPAKR